MSHRGWAMSRSCAHSARDEPHPLEHDHHPPRDGRSGGAVERARHGPTDVGPPVRAVPSGTRARSTRAPASCRTVGCWTDAERRWPAHPGRLPSSVPLGIRGAPRTVRRAEAPGRRASAEASRAPPQLVDGRHRPVADEAAAHVGRRRPADERPVGEQRHPGGVRHADDDDEPRRRRPHAPPGAGPRRLGPSPTTATWSGPARTASATARLQPANRGSEVATEPARVEAAPGGLAVRDRPGQGREGEQRAGEGRRPARLGEVGARGRPGEQGPGVVGGVVRACPSSSTNRARRVVEQALRPTPSHAGSPVAWARASSPSARSPWSSRTPLGRAHHPAAGGAAQPAVDDVQVEDEARRRHRGLEQVRAVEEDARPRPVRPRPARSTP